jgi:hypothetical protein
LAVPVLFGNNGAAAVSGSGPCALGLAKAIRTVGLDRWPRVVAAMADQASAEEVVTLPPGNYYAPLVPLMNRILAVRPGDDVSALHRAISEAFYAKGDTIGGNQVNALLSDMTEAGGNLAVRQGVADELAHYARTDPEQVAQFRTDLVGGALVGGAAATVDNSKAPITTEVLRGQQGKHIVGSPNYNPARGTLTADPKVLLENFSGRGIPVGRTPVGEPGSKELFDTGNKTIGTWRNRKGVSAPTTRGMIHYAKHGAHIVPAAPRRLK